MKNRLAPATRLAQALRFMDAETGALIPPIQPSATYARGPDYNERKSYIYRRDSNQTTEHAEKIIADLEDASETMLFASGMSAAVAIMEALPAGAHVVIPEVMYHGVLHQFRRYAEMNRLDVSTYPAADLDGMKAALHQGATALVWVETPNNPDWDVTDIAAAAKIAHAAGALLVTDCTSTPPCCTRALDLGADISFHSATKYLNGHSDVTAGALSVRETSALWRQIYEIRKLQGTVLHSFDAFLLIRGMRSLMLRVEKATENALTLAAHLEDHPLVDRVLFPGLPSHPGHEIAKRQTGGALWRDAVDHHTRLRADSDRHRSVLPGVLSRHLPRRGREPDRASQNRLRRRVQGTSQPSAPQHRDRGCGRSHCRSGAGPQPRLCVRRALGASGGSIFTKKKGGRFCSPAQILLVEPGARFA